MDKISFIKLFLRDALYLNNFELEDVYEELNIFKLEKEIKN